MFDGYSGQIIESSPNGITAIVPLIQNSVTEDKLVNLTYYNGSKHVEIDESFMVLSLWKVKQRAPFGAPWEYLAFTYDKKGFILELNSGILYEYNPVTNEWQALLGSAFPGERLERCLYITSGNKVYKVGGFNYSRQPEKEVWVYDFISGTWLQRNDIPFSFSWATYFTMNGYFFIVTNSGEVWKCDMENESYIRLNNAPFTFDAFASTFMHDDNVYLVKYQQTWLYNVAEDLWIEKDANPFVKQNYAEHAIGFALNNTGYVLLSGKYLYKYDAATGIWMLFADYPAVGNCYKTIFTVDDTAYFVALFSHSSAGDMLISFQEY
jgi:hypothetical protein